MQKTAQGKQVNWYAGPRQIDPGRKPKFMMVRMPQALYAMVRKAAPPGEISAYVRKLVIEDLQRRGYAVGND